MIRFKTYIDYFQEVAEQHVDILHSSSSKSFFRMNINEITGDMRSAIDPDSYCLVLESYQHNPKDLHSDNHLRDFIAAFSIIGRDPKLDDYDQQDIIIDKCEEIAEEISKRMYENSLDFENRFFTNIELGTFTFQKIGPIYNSWFGFRCQFDFSAKYDVAVDATKWNDVVDPPVIPVEGQFSMIVNVDDAEIYNEVWESQDSNTINIT